jgi:hypothetical protein
MYNGQQTMAGQEFAGGQQDQASMEKIAQQMGYDSAAAMMYVQSLGQSQDVQAEQGWRNPTQYSPYTGSRGLNRPVPTYAQPVNTDNPNNPRRGGR